MNYHFYSKELTQRTIYELKKMLEEGTVSSEELVWAYMEHTAAHNEQGMNLRAVRELNPDALAVARERDWERNQGKLRGELHGIPIMLKDSIDTVDRMHTSCGAAALKDHYAEKDAFIVEKLREAGAIILGKTHMSEFYGFLSSKAPEGYNGILKGTTGNPFGPGWLSTGGSSSGSAVAVAADFCAAAIGTDTAGSILQPAYLNGVVGYKPTVGLVSRTGILPCLACQDAAGPMTRSVRDAALLANILVARDEADPDTVRAEVFAEVDFADDMEFASVRGRRLGIVREGFYETMSKAEIDAFEKSLERLTAGGAELIEVENFAPAKLVTDESRPMVDDTVMCHGFKARIDHYLAGLKDVPFHSLKELVAWNAAHPEAIPMGQDYLEKIAAIDAPFLTADFVSSRMEALTNCGEMGIWKALDDYQLDALILPGTRGEGIAATAGNPTITIPAAYTEETGPIGLNLVGHLMGDMDLLYLARACEIALPKRTAVKL